MKETQQKKLDLKKMKAKNGKDFRMRKKERLRKRKKI
jgi:hypothetical protein